MRSAGLVILAALASAVCAHPSAAHIQVDAALRTQIEAQRTAHLTYDAAPLVALMSDDFTLVDNGMVTRPTRAESLARFQQYFAGVAFRAWDDIAPPEILVSADGTMATVLVTKLVRLVPRAQAANPQAPVTETRFAWLETWRREPVGWRLAQLASTRMPGG